MEKRNCGVFRPVESTGGLPKHPIETMGLREAGAREISMTLLTASWSDLT